MKDVHDILARMKEEKYAECPIVEGRVKIFIDDFYALSSHVGRAFTDECKVIKVVMI